MSRRRTERMKDFLIINCQKDPAGSNIFQRLLENYTFQKTEKTFASLPVFRSENILLTSSLEEVIRIGTELDDTFRSEILGYVFISKHRAESGIPALTVHFTGNFGGNDFGGEPGVIAKYSPSMLKNYFRALNSLRDEIPQEYQITLEATHHGPTSLSKPCMFVELGSNEQHWEDKKASLCIARALMLALSSTKKYDRCALGLGGTHYPSKFNQLLLNDELAMGVIAPKYSLSLVDEKMISQMVEKSEEKIDFAAIDWKGLGKEKSRVLGLINGLGLELVKV
jgi:D-aminoacyl-tRNA deacylase